MGGCLTCFGGVFGWLFVSFSSLKTLFCFCFCLWEPFYWLFGGGHNPEKLLASKLIKSQKKSNKAKPFYVHLSYLKIIIV